MCCLGVLYDVTQDAYWELDEATGNWRTSLNDSTITYLGESNTLESFGVSLIGDDLVRELAQANDRGQTFLEIADRIELVIHD